MTRLAMFVVVVAACSSSATTDVTGPFTGDVHRYAVDRITLPVTNAQQAELGDDLDGDASIDDQLGTILAALSATHDATTHGADMIASGALASSLTIQADDLTNDASVGVAYLGADGDDATVAGGTLTAGAYASNRTRTTHAAGHALIRLPVFADADPVALDVIGLELDLAPDGAGGFDVLVRGGVTVEQARAAASASVAQMMANNPGAHLTFAHMIDADHDGVITQAEIASSALLAAFLVADVTVPEGPVLSIGFGAHVIPCPAGSCAVTTPADRCHDRLLDGDETAIDCGGSCGGCPTAAACQLPADCQSRACDAGHCRAPTCSDGVADGFESGVDCGGSCTATCP